MNVFFTILLSFPLGNWCTCSPSLKQIGIPFTQAWFVPGLVEIGPVVLKKILKFLQCIFAILLLSPLGKECDPSFELGEIPQVSWKTAHSNNAKSNLNPTPVVLEKKVKMWKVYDNNNNNNNREWQWTNLDQKSSLEPSAQVS